MITSRWFKEAEFNRCTPSCSLQDIKQEAINMLDKAREIAGIPIVLNSTFRTIKYEKSKGRSGTSAHTEGVAFDIRCNSDTNRYKLVVALLKAGFNRIGVYRTFIHADCSTSSRHTQNVIWYGK